MLLKSEPDTVMALPLRPIEKAVTTGFLIAVSPRVMASGIGASICAASSIPSASLSLIFAHEVSLESVTSRPCFSKRPFSFATTSGAQSVNGIKPIFRLTFSSDRFVES